MEYILSDSPRQIHLCLNCLSNGGSPYQLGYAKGSQLDSYYNKIDLCSACSDLLEKGKLQEFHERFTESRVVSRSKTTVTGERPGWFGGGKGVDLS